ncbi:hypothetical protein VP150E351_P0091 [Vibrio phage 150E35-1]|nr:hypothetical protein VP150E351_P0091 [Vibrio phage 150E35-1]
MSFTITNELNEVLEMGREIGLIDAYYVDHGKFYVKYVGVDDKLSVMVSRSDWQGSVVVAVTNAIRGYISAKRRYEVTKHASLISNVETE